MNELQDLKNIDGIAIIAMVGQFPGSKNVDDFWKNLCDGKECLTRFSLKELERSGEDQTLLNNPHYVPVRGILDQVDLFDASLFGYSPGEAEIMDPQHRLFLQYSWEVLEKAGYNPFSCPKTVGVFAATSMSSYLFNYILPNQACYRNYSNQIIISNDKDFIATRVSYKLNLRGPAITVQTACSSALTALHTACQSLATYECDMAITGAVSISLPQERGYLYEEGGIQSPDGHCYPFDARACGTVFGNGIGIVLLKRIRDALQDHDNIIAVIKGSSINNDGALKVGYTAPSSPKQTDVIYEAQVLSGVDPETITYIECHGTGTKLGDPIEIKALIDAFQRRTKKTNYCALGAVKANIGHIDIAAGIAGLIKTALCLRHKILVPQINFEALNPDFHLSDSPFYVQKDFRKWETNGYPRRAGLSSFGIGGTNVHIILEEAPRLNKSGLSRPYQILAITSHYESSCSDYRKRLHDYLTQNPMLSFADCAYTLITGHKHFDYRYFLVCRDREDALQSIIESRAENSGSHKPDGQKYIPVVFFPDGIRITSQALRQFLKEERYFQKSFYQYCRIISEKIGEDLIKILHQDGEEWNLQTQDIFNLIAQFSIAELWLHWGIDPQFYLGQGIGEYLCAYFSGYLSRTDCIDLILLYYRYHWLQNKNVYNADYIDRLQELWKHIKHLIPAKRYYSLSFHKFIQEEIRDAGFWIYHFQQNQKKDTPAIYLSNYDFPKKNLIVIHIGQQIQSDTIKENEFILLHSLPADVHKSILQQLLTSLGYVWSYGIEPDWTKFYQEENRNRIELPTSPLHLDSYWASSFSGQEQPAKDQIVKKADQEDWFYYPGWKKSVIYPFISQFSEGQKYWALFSHDLEIARNMKEQLIQRGAIVRIVLPGETFQESEDYSVIQPGQKEDYEKLIQHWQKEHFSPQVVLHTYLMNREVPKVFSETQAAKIVLNQGFYSLLFLSQVLSGVDKEKKVLIVLMSYQLQQVFDYERIVPAKSAILGPVKVIPREMPHIRCSSIDIEEKYDVSGLLNLCISEVLQQLPDLIVAYRSGNRWIESVDPYPVPRTSLQNKKIRENGTYLITGGLGGIGLILAKELSRECTINLILTGRSAFPERKLWSQIFEEGQQSPYYEKIKTLMNLEQNGSIVIPMQSDVTKEDDVKQLCTEITGRFGHIDGIIHAAGIPGGGLALLKTEDIAEKVLAPKVYGTLFLHQYFQNQKPDFIVLCSSMSAVIGEPGQVDYCAANAFLDAFALQNQRGNYISINWFTFKESGMTFRISLSGDMQEKRLEMLMRGISNQEGMELFRKIIAIHPSRIAVSTISYHQLVNLYQEMIGSIGQLKTIDLGKRKTRPELSNEYIAPLTEREKEIVEIWESYLGIHPIGVEDNFFDLGGHSLFATQIISTLRDRMDMQITLEDFFEQPTIRLCANAYEKRVNQGESSQQTTEIKAYQKYSYAFLEEDAIQTILNTNEKIEDIYTLSPMQGMVLAHNIFQKQKGLSVHYYHYEIRGALDIDLFRLAWETVIEQHALLRTGFLWRRVKHPVQLVYKKIEINFQVYDMRQNNEIEQKLFIENYLQNEKEKGFDIAKPPLYRFLLVKLQDDLFRFIWTYQNSLFDGYSTSIIFHDLFHNYRLLKENKEIVYQKADFLDYIQWLNQQDEEKNRSYWQSEFVGYSDDRNIEDLRVISPDVKYTPEIKEEWLDVIFSNKLMKLSKDKSLTINTLFFGVWSLTLLAEHTLNDMICGLVTAGRPLSLKGNDRIVGLFANTLPIRIRYQKEILVIDWLFQLQKKIFQAGQYEYASLHQISQWGNIPVPYLQEAIQNHLMVFLNYPEEGELWDEYNDLRVELLTSRGIFHLPLRFYVIPNEKTIKLELRYNSEVYRQQEIESILNRMRLLLEYCCKNINVPVQYMIQQIEIIY